MDPFSNTPEQTQARGSPAAIPTLPYATPVRNARPGILTAVGIISIVLACLSGLMSLQGTIQGPMMYFVSSGTLGPGMQPGGPMPATSADPVLPEGFVLETPTTEPPPESETSETSAISEEEAWALMNQSTTAPTFGTAATPPTPPPFVFGKVSPASAIAMSAANLFELGLAVFLLIAGICVLRDSARARRMHLWFAGLKMPAVVLSNLAGWWMMSEYMSASSFAGVASPLMVNAVMAIGLAFNVLLAWVYPIALLIVMNTSRIKAFYISLQPGGDNGWMAAPR